MEIAIINKSTNPLPKYETKQAAGLDICADLKGTLPVLHNSFINSDGDVVLRVGGRALIPTGLCIALPEGLEAQVRPRSGLAIKKGITVLNSPGTIDADYRGEICVILINLGLDNVTISHGEKIAQLVISKYEQVTWKETDTLDETERGTGGFGHTSEKQEDTSSKEQKKSRK